MFKSTCDSVMTECPEPAGAESADACSRLALHTSFLSGGQISMQSMQQPPAKYVSRFVQHFSTRLVKFSRAKCNNIHNALKTV